MNTPWSQIRHFEPKEFGPEPGRVDPLLIARMDIARELVGRRFDIHVSFAVSGHSPKSAHYLGEALDGHFTGASRPELFLEELRALRACGFLGIGFYPEWSPRPGWHADVMDRGDGRRVEWVRINGSYIYTPGIIENTINKYA